MQLLVERDNKFARAVLADFAPLGAEGVEARVWSDGCQQRHRAQHGAEMAWSLATNHYGHLCKRRRGGGAEYCVEDVALNRISLITPVRPTR
jgi:hypothetical protein